MVQRNKNDMEQKKIRLHRSEEGDRRFNSVSRLKKKNRAVLDWAGPAVLWFMYVFVLSGGLLAPPPSCCNP